LVLLGIIAFFGIKEYFYYALVPLVIAFFGLCYWDYITTTALKKEAVETLDGEVKTRLA